MKATRTEYLKMWEQRKEAANLAENARVAGNWELKLECEALVIEIDSAINKYFPTVPVKYWIGYRQYFEEVVKIGKSYFQYGKAMTKGRGYRSITEIPEITEKMNQEMIADSYYY